MAGRPIGGSMTRIGPTGVLITAAEPHSPEWYAARADGIGSSEIAAVLGLPGAYTSPFDLYWRKASGEVSESSDRMRWGTRLEPIIRDAWRETHPEFYVWPAPGVVMHVDRPWQRCSPDGIAYDDIEDLVDGGDADALAAVECKSDNNRAGWGEPGTDAIPPHYLAQVRWQLDTLGLTVAYVAVTFGGPPVEYVVEHDETDASLMRQAAREFLDRLEAGTPPTLDWHAATTRRLKALHPDVDDTEADLPAALIAKRRKADARVKHWERLRDLYDNETRALLGRARVGVVGGEKAVTRSVSNVVEKQIRKPFTRDSLYFTKERAS